MSTVNADVTDRAVSLGQTATPLLAVDGLVSGYGKIPVLHEVSLRVDEGEIVTIVGPNGAGKSTVLKTVMGYLRPTAGRVTFRGEGITGEPVPRVVRRGIAYVPQGRVVFPKMTVGENLEMGAFLVRDRRRREARQETVFGIFPVLRDRRRQLAGTLSGGEQQMLAMGRAMMIAPVCTLMDEPSLGLAPKFVDLIFAKIVEMRRAGMSVLLVEQNAARALAVAERGYVLELGRNWADGPGGDLLQSEEIRRMFVGGSTDPH
jgi:branched-chain amino acid transport system ATP-binding protein